MKIFNPNTPFNHLPPLPPKTDIETKKILNQCIRSRTALAELKIAGELIPNQTVLINTLPLLEAKDSSEIENIVTTTDKLFRFSQISDEHADPSTKEALRYRKALLDGFQSLEKTPFSFRTAKEICSTIKDYQMDIRRVPGTKLKNKKTGKIIYTPPEGEDLLNNLITNWEKFMHNKNDLDPLIKMAVGHYQFEAIHPFTDGNGRAGRILNILFLISENLLTLPTLYLSHFIIQNRTDYYAGLNNVTTEGSWENWILFMLKGVEEMAIWTKEKILAIKKLMDHTRKFIKHSKPQIYSHELAEIIFIQPYCRISNLIEAKIAERQTASVYLKELCTLGILEELKIGREKIFVHPKFMKLLTGKKQTFRNY